MKKTKLILKINLTEISALILLSLTAIGCSHHAVKNDVPRNPANESEVIDYSCLPRSETDDSIPKMSALSGFAVGPAARVFSSPDEKILRPFYSDGCSESPDKKTPWASESKSWSSCCYQHDIAYWAGGTESAKDEADANLEKCIADKGYSKTGKLYRAFVGWFGGPNQSQTYRWGYGWNARRPYGPLTEQEEKQISDLYKVKKSDLADYLTKNPSHRRICRTDDPALRGFSEEEKIVYQLLNSKLENNDLIEWAKWGYFNLEKRDFEVKLRSCQTPVIFSFFKSLEKNSKSAPARTPQITSSCGIN